MTTLNKVSAANGHMNPSLAELQASTVFPRGSIRDGEGAETAATAMEADITPARVSSAEWTAPIRVRRMIDSGSDRVGGDVFERRRMGDPEGSGSGG